MAPLEDIAEYDRLNAVEEVVGRCLYGRSVLRKAFPAWDAWQRRLSGREPTEAERQQMYADMRAAMGEEAPSSTPVVVVLPGIPPGVVMCVDSLGRPHAGKIGEGEKSS